MQARAVYVVSNVMPIARELVAAARIGDYTAFRKYVMPGATMKTSDGVTSALRMESLQHLATYCQVQTMSFRLLELNDEIGIFWRCPAGNAQTRLNFTNLMVVGAESSEAVVHVVRDGTAAMRREANR